MRTRRIASLLIAAALLAPAPFARGEEPAADKSDQSAPAKAEDANSVEAMESRANEAFERGEWTQALPLLNKLKEHYKDDEAKRKPVEEKIAEAQKRLTEQLEKEGKAPPGGAAPAAPVGPPSDEERKPHAKPADGQPYATTIQELGNFQFDQEKGGNIPKDVKALDGATVRLSGYMIPLDQADKIKQFVLVPDLFACCFGQPPQVQHSVIVTCPEGKAVSYFPDQIQVEGKLKVEEKKDDGYIISIFEVACTSVKPAPK
jgi:hypothetical protein